MKATIQKVLILGVSIFAATACGVAPQVHTQNSSKFKTISAENPNIVYEDGQIIGNPGSQNSNNESSATYLFNVKSVGYSGSEKTYKVWTKNILRVRFKPGVQNEHNPGTGYSSVYSKLGVFFSVNSDERSTGLLSNGARGQTEKSGILEFSDSLSGCGVGCEGQYVTITVKKPNYDYFCLNYGIYCPYTHVSPNHPWNGVLEVETDFTKSLQ